jgi:diaminopimelate epimerase
MTLPFSKYHGTGNDFIIIDNRLIQWKPTLEQVSFLCDRHFGIGADGLMLLSDKTRFDFAMTYYNSDGNESTMCGNGGRCMTAFAKTLGLVDDSAHFWAIDGAHEAIVLTGPDESLYKLRMKDTEIGHVYHDGIFTDTGSPHFVQFVDDAAATDVFGLGKKSRNDPRFAPGGSNVNFVEVLEEGLFVRTFERGVENETLSCGTGVTASALAHAFTNPDNPGFYMIKTLGGALSVSFKQTGKHFTDVWLEGPAKFVYKGVINNIDKIE